MAWYLIGGGFLFIIFSLFIKIKEKDDTEKSLFTAEMYEKNKQKNKQKNNRKKNLPQAKEENLSDINNNINKILSLVISNQKQIINQINMIDKKSDENNFNNVLENKLKKQKPEIDNNTKQIPQKYKDVFSLLQQGKKPGEIAQELNLGIRETNMILKLYNKGQKKNG